MTDLTNRHPATQQILQYFHFDHLSDPAIRSVSKASHDLAIQMVDALEDGPELTAGLRKLLEAKDCFVRHAVLAGAQPSPSTKEFHVTCPVCGEVLHFEGRIELWGQIHVNDIGCGSVTLPWAPEVNEHLDVHRQDGTYIEKLAAHWEYLAEHAPGAAERIRASMAPKAEEAPV